MDSKLDRSYPLPLIVSDNWDQIKDAVEEVYGVEYLPAHDGRGRPCSKSRFAPRPDLKYAQVVKVKDAHGNLEKVETTIVHGDPINVTISLILSGSRSISIDMRKAEPIPQELREEIRKEDYLLLEEWRVPGILRRDTLGLVQLHQEASEPEDEET